MSCLAMLCWIPKFSHRVAHCAVHMQLIRMQSQMRPPGDVAAVSGPSRVSRGHRRLRWQRVPRMVIAPLCLLRFAPFKLASAAKTRELHATHARYRCLTS